MSERKIWKQEQDEILKRIYEVEGITNWSQIAKIMSQDYKIFGRTGKQCRQRYHNHLKDGISKEKWSKQEQQHLVELHSKYGNRWALISTFIKGRSENCIKNMLYSKLRKAVRQINKIIFIFFRKQLKEIKVNFITRLIEFTQKFYKNPDTQTTQQYQIALNIKNFMLMFDYDEQDKLTEQQKMKVKEIVQSISEFKKVNQRFRFKNNTNKAIKSGEKAVVKVKDRLTKFEQIEEESDQSHSDSYSKKEVKNKKKEKKVDEEKQQQLQNKQQLQKKERQSRGKIEQIKNIIEKAPTKTNSFISYANKTQKKMGQQLTKLPDVVDQKKQQQAPTQVRRISKFAGRRLDSIQSNRSYLLVDTQIQKPIFLQSIITLTPTPYHRGHNYNDWSSITNVWKNNIYNNQQ